MTLDPETLRSFINAFRQAEGHVPALMGVRKETDVVCQSPPPKQPWWKKLSKLFVGTAPKTQKWHLGLHSSVQSNVALAAAWTAYGGTKWLVRDGKYAELYPETRGQTSPFEEQCFARDALAEFWAAQSADVQAIDPYLQLLVKLRAAGLMREYVWRFFRTNGSPEPAGLDPQRLEAWMTGEGVIDHKPLTLALILPEEEARDLLE